MHAGVTGRNAPCPCGSGRKYKHCCQASDLAALAESSAQLPFDATRLDAHVRAAASRAGSWQVEAVPVPIAIDNERNARPVAVLIVADGYVLHSRLRARLGGEADDVAAALELGIGVAARRVDAYPPVIEVRHADVAEALRARLQTRTMAVHVRDPLPELQELATSLSEHVTGQAAWPPACASYNWAAWSLPHALVGELFVASASYWRAAPWRILTNLQAPRVTMPGGDSSDSREWTACVLGNGGAEFGLALYSDELDLFRMHPTADPGHAFAGARGRVISLTFDSSTNVPRAVRADVARAGWRLADADAFPLLITVNTPGGGISQRDARDLCVLLELLPQYVTIHEPALVRDQVDGRAADRLSWRHGPSGSVFAYDGLDSVLRKLEAEGIFEDEPADVLSGPDVELDTAQLSLPFDSSTALREVVSDLDPALRGDELLRAVNERVHTRVRNYNEQPQTELGNLSPAQVQRLLEADWSQNDVVRLRRDLALEAVGASALLHNTRTLLNLTLQHDGLLLTQQATCVWSSCAR
jgi:SEC-C motif-containing protein